MSFSSVAMTDAQNDDRCSPHGASSMTGAASSDLALQAQQMLAVAMQNAQRLNHSSPGVPETPVPGVIPTTWLDPSSRHARKLYIGNLPSSVVEPELITELTLVNFFNDTFENLLPRKTPGPVVIGCNMNPLKKYAFIEHRSILETNYCLSLDGLVWYNTPLKIRRPMDYNATQASEQLKAEHSRGEIAAPPQVKPQGLPLEQHQSADSMVQSLGIISSTVEEGPNKIFLGGLPIGMDEDELKTMLSAYGPMKSLHMVREKPTHPTNAGQFRGYCFFEYREPIHTDPAITALHGQKIGDRVLTCRRAQQEGGEKNAAKAASILTLGHDGKLGAEAAIHLQHGSLPWINSMYSDLHKRSQARASPNESDGLDLDVLNDVTTVTTYGKPGRCIGVRNALAVGDAEEITRVTNQLRAQCETYIGSIRNVTFNHEQGGQVLLEFATPLQSYRAVKWLNKAVLFGRKLFCAFVPMAKEMQHTSLMRIVEEANQTVAILPEERQLKWKTEAALEAARNQKYMIQIQNNDSKGVELCPEDTQRTMDAKLAMQRATAAAAALEER